MRSMSFVPLHIQGDIFKTAPARSSVLKSGSCHLYCFSHFNFRASQGTNIVIQYDFRWQISASKYRSKDI